MRSCEAAAAELIEYERPHNDDLRRRQWCQRAGRTRGGTSPRAPGWPGRRQHGDVVCGHPSELVEVSPTAAHRKEPENPNPRTSDGGEYNIERDAAIL
jgi:hypothetical protein